MQANPHLAGLPPCSRVSRSAEQLFKALDCEQIDLRLVKALTFKGIPDEPAGLRALLWRVLLGYLPLRPADWEASLAQQRENYAAFKAELLVMPDVAAEEDHPLAVHSGSRWQLYFKDQELWDGIEKDIRRTRMDMHFFFTPCDSSLTLADLQTENCPKRTYSRPYITGAVELLEGSSNSFLHAVLQNPDVEKHADVLARILFIYSKLNPGLSYVQGMNEVLAPLYYLFAHDSHELFAGHCEPDAFYCFVGLMSQIRDTFVNSLDSSDSGLAGQLQRMCMLLEKHDRRLLQMLEHLKISPYYYAMKWIVLLMSQELSLPDIYRLWDTLFSEDDPFTFLHYICVALLLRARPQIMQGDFAEALHAIQHLQIDSITDLIHEAERLYRRDRSAITQSV